jgi:hypothetical protein
MLCGALWEVLRAVAVKIHAKSAAIGRGGQFLTLLINQIPSTTGIRPERADRLLARQSGWMTMRSYDAARAC